MTELTIIVVFTLVALAAWLINIIGMPGNWIIVALAAGSWWWGEAESRLHMSMTVLAIILIVVLIGELLEFLASALGASRMGGSKRGTLLALVGSIAGALFGLFGGVLIPIPIIGPVVASLLLGATGAFAGAILGERWKGRDWEASIEIGGGAFRGRLLGTVAKGVCGTLALGLYLSGIWF